MTLLTHRHQREPPGSSQATGGQQHGAGYQGYHRGPAVGSCAATVGR